MTSLHFTALRVFATAVAMLAGVAAAFGQSGNQPAPGFLNGLFGNGESPAPANRDRLPQASAGDLVLRIDRLEAQVRQLTGVIEQLQFRNQQLADQLRRTQEDGEQRLPSGQARTTVAPVVAPVAPAAPPGRRGDAFDPTQNPTAPGTPRSLGTISAAGAVPPNQPPDLAADELPIGAPGGRAAGEPLNLSTMRGNIGADPPAGSAGEGAAGAPPRNPAAGGTAVATLPPSDSPKDNFDLAYGYILHKDYALAEDGFRSFLRRYPSDRLAPDAQYWLGESMFQRQRYRDAAEAFLNVSTKYESTAKAPDALLRLGQSLAVLGEKEAACASLGEVLRKYPRAALSVKQGVDREQKRAGC
jgi:tol-pal system protein YbgF